VEGAAAEAWKRAQKVINQSKRSENFARYINDPVAFGEEVLGEFYTDDVKNVMHSVRDNIVTIARSATDVGKSHAAARICMWFFSVYPDCKIYLTAAPPVENLKQILWGEILGIVRKRPTIVSGSKVRSLGIYRTPKSFISGVSIPMSGTSAEREAKFSGKHAPQMLFIVDEGDAVPDEVYKGIEGCMSGGEVIRLLIMFNPRAAMGPVYFKERTHQANVIELSAFRHPNVIKGEHVIPGAVTRETTLRRINTWTEPLAQDSPEAHDTFDVPNFLVGKTTTGLDGRLYEPLKSGKRRIIDPAFYYMVLGKYPAQSSHQLISDVWIDNARTRHDAYVSRYGDIPPQGVRPILGLDLAELGVDSNVAIFRWAGYVGKPIMWAGVDPDASATKALDLYLKHRAKMAMVDGTGVGAGVAPAMARRGRSEDVRAVSVKVASKPSPVIKADQGDFNLLRDQLWWALREWRRKDEGAMLPPDPYLLDELRAVEYKVDLKGNIKVTDKDTLRDRLKRSPDRADALCLTFAPFKRPTWVRAGDGKSFSRDSIVTEEQEKELFSSW